MARRVVWTEPALTELENAARYIEADSLRYSKALVTEAWQVARSLKSFPNRGRIVPELSDNSVRELFVKNYRLIYQVWKDEILILAFIHGARELPNL